MFINDSLRGRHKDRLFKLGLKAVDKRIEEAIFDYLAWESGDCLCVCVGVCACACVCMWVCE